MNSKLSLLALIGIVVLFGSCPPAGAQQPAQEPSQQIDDGVDPQAILLQNRLQKQKDVVISAIKDMSTGGCADMESVAWLSEQDKSSCLKVLSHRAVLLEALDNMSLNATDNNPFLGSKTKAQFIYDKGPYKTSKSKMASELSLNAQGTAPYSDSDLFSAVVVAAAHAAGLKDPENKIGSALEGFRLAGSSWSCPGSYPKLTSSSGLPVCCQAQANSDSCISAREGDYSSGGGSNSSNRSNSGAAKPVSSAGGF